MSIKEKIVGMGILSFCVLLLFNFITGSSAIRTNQGNKSLQTVAQTPQPTTESDTLPTTTASQTPNIQLFKVTQVIDGDTIQVVIDNKKETIRLIGIDTPETVDPRKPVQCFGKEASAKAKSLLSGKSVRLESDPTQGERDGFRKPVSR